MAEIDEDIDLQSIIAVCQQDPASQTWQREEAFQLNFDGTDEVPTESLLSKAIELTRPASFNIEERRNKFSWGAEGGLIQKILIQFGSELASGVTIASLLAAFRKLSRRRQNSTASGSEMIHEAHSAEAAWVAFASFLEKAFTVTHTRVFEIKEDENEWRIKAYGDHGHFQGTVSKDGRVLWAKQGIWD